MHIIVLMKEVPDMEKVRFDTEKGVIDRKSAGTEVNPFDLNALEAAVQLKESAGATVTALCMGPPQAEKSLKEALSRGADEALLLSDTAFGGSDTWATARTLAAAIGKIGTYDAIFAGEKTVDGDTGQVGAQVAQLLALPLVSYAESLCWEEGTGLAAVVSLWDGFYRKTVTGKGLFTFTKTANTPRLPGVRDKMKARKAVIPCWKLADLAGHLDASETGFSGSPTKVKRIVIPPAPQRQGQCYRDALPEALDQLETLLKSKHLLKEVEA
ncbi:electron transfer flavoprotein subunit beta/FixA family protein [Anoxynatronum sibiricum]|uniref:Electron transfer flavoprotein small subunit n=1 Tax=Anoxynatronum sibiricum TaxID=210623 RepID=A0ABU9VS63_9CLOT